MHIREQMERFYLDMAVNELRLANCSRYQKITYNSLLYLDLIAYHENCTVSYLAEVLHIAKSAVTLKIHELEKLGLVEKRQSAADKRIYYLYVNQALLEEYKTYDNVLYSALDQLEKTYSSEQIDTFCRMLDSLNQAFQIAAEKQKGGETCIPWKEK